MKIVLDVVQKGPLKDGDILVYNDGRLINIRREQYFADVNKEICELKEECKQLKADMIAFKEGVNAKLEQYHNILQTLVKEN